MAQCGLLFAGEVGVRGNGVFRKLNWEKFPAILHRQSCGDYAAFQRQNFLGRELRLARERAEAHQFRGVEDALAQG